MSPLDSTDFFNSGSSLLQPVPAFVGATNAIAIYGGALIRIINCGIHAQVVAGSGPDAVNTSSTGCRSCNIVYHSNNTALLVENTHVIP